MRDSTLSSDSAERTPLRNPGHSRRAPKARASCGPSSPFPVEYKAKARISRNVEINEIPSFKNLDNLPGSKRSETKSEPPRSVHMVNFRLDAEDLVRDSCQSSLRGRSLKSAPGRINRSPVNDGSTTATDKTISLSSRSKTTPSLSAVSVTETMRRASSKTALSRIAFSRGSRSSGSLLTVPRDSRYTTCRSPRAASASFDGAAAPELGSNENFVRAEMTPTGVHSKPTAARAVSLFSIGSSDDSLTKLCDNVISLGLYQPGEATSSLASDAVLLESEAAASNLLKSTAHSDMEPDVLRGAIMSVALADKHRLDGDPCAREQDCDHHAISSTPRSRHSRKSNRSTRSTKNALQCRDPMKKFDGTRNGFHGSSNEGHRTSDERHAHTGGHHDHLLDAGSHDVTAPEAPSPTNSALFNLKSPLSRHTIGRSTSYCLSAPSSHADLQTVTHAVRPPAGPLVERPVEVTSQPKGSILKQAGLCTRSTSTVNFSLENNPKKPHIGAVDEQEAFQCAGALPTRSIGIRTATDSDSSSRSSEHASRNTAMDGPRRSASTTATFSRAHVYDPRDGARGARHDHGNAVLRAHTSPRLPNANNFTHGSLAMTAQKTDSDTFHRAGLRTASRTDSDRFSEAFRHSSFLRETCSNISLLEQQTPPCAADEPLSTLRHEEKVQDSMTLIPHRAHSRHLRQSRLDNLMDTALVESEIAALEPSDEGLVYSEQTDGVPLEVLSELKSAGSSVLRSERVEDHQCVSVTMTDHRDDQSAYATPRSKKSGKSGRSRKSSYYVRMAMNKLDGARGSAQDLFEVTSQRSCPLASPTAAPGAPSVHRDDCNISGAPLRKLSLKSGKSSHSKKSSHCAHMAINKLDDARGSAIDRSEVMSPKNSPQGSRTAASGTSSNHRDDCSMSTAPLRKLSLKSAKSSHSRKSSHVVHMAMNKLDGARGSAKDHFEETSQRSCSLASPTATHEGPSNHRDDCSMSTAPLRKLSLKSGKSSHSRKSSHFIHMAMNMLDGARGSAKDHFEEMSQRSCPLVSPTAASGAPPDHRDDCNMSATRPRKLSLKSGKSSHSRKSSHDVHIAMNKLDGARGSAKDHSEMMSPKSCSLGSPTASFGGRSDHRDDCNMSAARPRKLSLKSGKSSHSSKSSHVVHMAMNKLDGARGSAKDYSEMMSPKSLPLASPTASLGGGSDHRDDCNMSAAPLRKLSLKSGKSSHSRKSSHVVHMAMNKLDGACGSARDHSEMMSPKSFPLASPTTSPGRRSDHRDDCNMSAVPLRKLSLKSGKSSHSRKSSLYALMAMSKLDGAYGSARDHSEMMSPKSFPLASPTASLGGRSGHRDDCSMSAAPLRKLSLKSGKSSHSRKSSHYVHMAMNKLDGARSSAKDHSEVTSQRSCPLASPTATSGWPSKRTSTSKVMQRPYEPEHDGHVLSSAALVASLTNLCSPVTARSSDTLSKQRVLSGDNETLVSSTLVVRAMTGDMDELQNVGKTPDENAFSALPISQPKNTPSVSTSTATSEKKSCERGNHLKLPPRTPTRKKGSILKMLDTMSAPSHGSHVVFSEAADAWSPNDSSSQPPLDCNISCVSTTSDLTMPDGHTIHDKTTDCRPSGACSLPLNLKRAT